MFHEDILPEHSCDGELIKQTNQFTRLLTVMWCLGCGTEFRYEPDTAWVTIIYPGMRRSLDWPT